MEFNFGLTAHKFVEIEFRNDEWDNFLFLVNWTKKSDHAGLTVHFAVLRWGVRFNLYDHRHWDDENDTWLDPERTAAQDEEIERLFSEERIRRMSDQSPDSAERQD